MVQALHTMSSRIAARLRAVQEEARRVGKALTLGIPRATHGRHIPLTYNNCLSPGVNPHEVRCGGGETGI